MARLFTCADVLEQLEDSNGDVSSGDDSAYEGEGIADADELSGTENIHDMDLETLAHSAMDERYSIARI